MLAFQIVSFGVFLLLALLSFLRVAKTSPVDPDLSARKITSSLLILLTIGMGISLLRTQFLPQSLQFITLSLLLVPVGMVALAMIIRLIVDYRRSEATSSDDSLPDITSLQTRIGPPKNGNGPQ